MPFDAPDFPLHTFVATHGEALLKAAELLGGDAARRRAARLLADLHPSKPLTRRSRSEFEHMRQLLALDYVGDPERIESAFFAEIDPGDRIVGELCQMHDALEAALSGA